MNDQLENKSRTQGIFWQNWKQLAVKAEIQVMIFLIILVLTGAMYNIVRAKEPNFSICPLCEEPTNYKDEPRISTYTF